jgi:hypothetical protein
MVEFLSDGDLNKVRTIKGLLRFHHFKPSFNGFLYICKGFFMGFPLRKASRKCWNFSDIITRFVFFDHYMQFHGYLLFCKYTIKNFSLAILKRRRYWEEYLSNTPILRYSDTPILQYSIRSEATLYTRFLIRGFPWIAT